LNDYLSERERGLCTTCSSYNLCMPQCEEATGEWGACGMFKKIVQWDDECDRWWNVKERKHEREMVIDLAP